MSELLRLDFVRDEMKIDLDLGDIVIGVGGESHTVDIDGMWMPDDGRNCDRYIKSFAPRKNEGAQPVGDDVVVDVYDGLAGYCTRASQLNWSLKEDEGHYTVKTYTPNYDALLKMQNEFDKKESEVITDKEMKIVEAVTQPIYTKAMQDAGEMPSVGMSFICDDNTADSRISDFHKREVEVIGISKLDGKSILTFSHPTMGIGCGVFDMCWISYIETRTPEEIEAKELEVAKKEQREIVAGALSCEHNKKFNDHEPTVPSDFFDEAGSLQDLGLLDKIILPSKGQGMIKAILMIYVFVALLVVSILTPHKELVGFCMGGSFASGMACFYFISNHSRKICK